MRAISNLDVPVPLAAVTLAETVDSPCPHDWVAAYSAARPESPAVDTPRIRLSYGVLHRRVMRLATELQKRGLKPSERVLISLSNSPAAVVVALAVQAAGGCAVEASPDLGPEALRAVGEQLRPRLAFIRARDARRWASFGSAMALERVWLVDLEPIFSSPFGESRSAFISEAGELEAPGDASRMEIVKRDPASPALVLFKPGTSGAPRGVVLSFTNLAANAAAVAQVLDLGFRDRTMVVHPLSSAYGRNALDSHLFAGGSIFLEERSVYPRVVLDTLVSEGCTGFSGLPATFETLRRSVAGAQAPGRLRYLTSAGGTLSAATAQWCSQTFAPAKIFHTFGQAEATSRLTYVPPDWAQRKQGSIGIPVPGVELRVVDDGGCVLGVGGMGELVARGPGVALGFLGAAGEQARAFRGGWLWTGNLAYRDADGFLFLADRAKEVLEVGGVRVMPARIEQVLARQAEIVEASVVGVPDAIDGEVPVAAVVPRRGAIISTEALQKACRDALGPAHVPRRVVTFAALPRNELGGVQRRELSRLLEARTFASAAATRGG